MKQTKKSLNKKTFQSSACINSNKNSLIKITKKIQYVLTLLSGQNARGKLKMFHFPFEFELVCDYVRSIINLCTT